MPAPASWDWSIGNINATAAQTRAAYAAITSNGPTRNFNVIVWNDIVNKIIEMRQYWGDTDWSIAGATKSQTWMTPSEQMTAKIFNACVLNMPMIHPWPWEATLGRKLILPGDRCYGAYFIYLTDALNHWIEDLRPVYINPPCPFNINLRYSNDTVVRRALHTMSNMSIHWIPHMNLLRLRAKHVAARMNPRLTINLKLPLFNVAAVEILLIGNIRTRNTMIAANAAHVISAEEYALTMNGKISFGDVVFVICPVDGTFFGSGTIGLPGSIPVKIASEFELTQTPLGIWVARPRGISGSIDGDFLGTCYAIEPDSILVKADMPIDLATSLVFAFSDILRVAANLAIDMAPAVKVFEAPAGHIAIALDFELTSGFNFSEIEGVVATGEIADAFELMATMDRRLRTLIYPSPLTFELSTSGLLGFAFDELPTACDMLSEFSSTALLAFSDSELGFSGSASGEFSGEALLDYATNRLGIKGQLSEEFTANALAAISRNAIRTGCTLLDMVSSASASIFAPRHPEYTSGSLLGESAFAATFGSGVLTAIDSDMTASYSGEGTVELDSLGAIESAIDLTFTGQAGLALVSAASLSANAQFSHTGSATIIGQQYTLASEIDDVLVSDLDDILVTDLEFHY
jgi:hypothetical protein